MKATNDNVKEFLKAALGLKIWNARETLGMKFELGKEVEKGRGEFGFWIFCSHWWLKKGKGTDFKDIVNSESNKNMIEKKVKVLDGKKLVGVEYHPDGLTTFFDFEDDVFLQASPYGTGDKTQEQWMFFSANQIVALSSNGNLSMKPIKE